MSNTDWWAKKLGQPVPSRQDVAPPMPPSQQPMTRYVPPQPTEPTTKARSAQQVQTCPECGSVNYMAVQNAAPRCYDCGYPVQQSGSIYGNLQGAKVEGGVKGALGNETANNFNPQGIIGRVQ